RQAADRAMSFLLDTDTCSAHLKSGTLMHRFVQYSQTLFLSRSQTLFGNAWRAKLRFTFQGNNLCLAVTQNGVLRAAFPNGVWERVAEWLDGGTPALIAAHLQEPQRLLQRLLRRRQIALHQVVLGPERHAGGPLS